MSQFRTSADIFNEVLQKSGEPTNGNSPFQTIGMTYLNKAHHAIVGGGSIFSLTVDEAWTWARAKRPIVLELQPEYNSTAAFTTAALTMSISPAPTISLEGYHLQAIGKRTIYKITQHSANSATATLDSSFVDASGSYNFRAFKLDYEVSPAYLYVDQRNDKLDFSETTAATNIAATLTHGSYAPADYISHVATQMSAVGTAAYTGAYDSVLRTFTLTSSLAGGKVFSLLGATGTNRQRSALPSLGYDRIDQTAAGTYASSYVINGINRLIEPFKVFTHSLKAPFVTASDPINMEMDYPMASVQKAIPTVFARLAEYNDGSMTVRFNSYPADVTKLVLDWIPVPHDLQNNAASFPLMPRSDVDVLIHAAAAFILYDKRDSEWQNMLSLAGKGLEAMQKRNRSELFRSGANFGQIVPRLDYTDRRKRLRYGYTADSD